MARGPDRNTLWFLGIWTTQSHRRDTNPRVFRDSAPSGIFRRCRLRAARLCRQGTRAPTLRSFPRQNSMPLRTEPICGTSYLLLYSGVGPHNFISRHGAVPHSRFPGCVLNSSLKSLFTVPGPNLHFPTVCKPPREMLVDRKSVV